MSYQPLAPGQTYPETPVNENMEALGQAFCFAHNKPADTGLDVGFSGGTFNGATLPDDVLTCTDDDENFVVAARADGALSVAITTTNWDDTATYGRVARVTFADGALTAFADERFSVGGIFDHQAPVDPDTLVVGIGVFLAGQPTASQLLLRYTLPVAVDFADDFGAVSRGSASAAATAQTDYDVKKNGSSVGTVRYAAAATTPSFITTGGAVSFAAGDVISYHAPTSPDATLADVDFTLVGTRA